MNLDFILDEDYLAYFILYKKMHKESKVIEDIKNKLFSNNGLGAKKLLEGEILDASIYLKDNDIKKIVDKFKNTAEFNKLYKETEIYLNKVKKYWVENKDIINNYLKRILRIDFDIKATVYITHPDTCEGYSFGDNKIVWGHYLGVEDSNYNIVYLTHEWLHCLLPFTNDDTDIDCYIKHTTIELISDYELYSLLKKESTLKEGHPYLKEYKKFMYPYWLKYIGLNDNEIRERLQRDNVDELVNTEDNYLKNMNIKDFISFCTNEYLKENKEINNTGIRR